MLATGPVNAVAWAANVWRDPAQIPISSIADAARKLRAIQRNWAIYSFRHHRRAALIAEKLPKVSAKPLAFGAPAPSAPLGSWTLIAPDMMLASASCSSPFPNGEPRFVEDRTAPSRAYLKLWELFTLVGERPQPGELCVDLGSSPGGWTWAELPACLQYRRSFPLRPFVSSGCFLTSARSLMSEISVQRSPACANLIA